MHVPWGKHGSHITYSRGTCKYDSGFILAGDNENDPCQRHALNDVTMSNEQFGPHGNGKGLVHRHVRTDEDGNTINGWIGVLMHYTDYERLVVDGVHFHDIESCANQGDPPQCYRQLNVNWWVR